MRSRKPVMNEQTENEIGARFARASALIAGAVKLIGTGEYDFEWGSDISLKVAIEMLGDAREERLHATKLRDHALLPPRDRSSKERTCFFEEIVK